MRLFQVAAVLAALTGPATGGELPSSAGTLSITPMAQGLEEPWGLAFLPDGGFLVTERDSGRLLLFAGPDAEPVALSGLPKVAAVGQGGLLDVMVPRDFAESREIYLSYSVDGFRNLATALGFGRLSEDGTALEGFRRIYRMPLGGRNGQHFGARIVEAPDGALFLTVGDRGEPDLAQDFGRDNGAVLRIARNGDIPADNPFASSWSAPRVFSKGHRNPQGAALDGEGRLWIVEHGAQGGDELNRVEAGRNYGWPAISYGLNYDGSKIGVGTEKAGMEQPVHYWDPSIAPSGLAVYSGRMIPQWAGDFLVGSLKFDMIARLDADAGMAEERLSAPETGRVRDVREAPDGSIWFLSVYDGAVYRMAPAGK